VAEDRTPAETGGVSPSSRAALAFSVLWLVYGALVRRFWFVSDDAYISFRFARNWAEGIGLRYNQLGGPPEEGFSNFLYVVIGALVESLGLSIELWLPLVGFASGSLLLLLFFRLALRRFGAPLPIAWLATATLGAAAPFAVWSSSGLETMLYALLVFATFERLILREEGADGVTAGALAALAALTRVEGVYWMLLLLPLAAFSRRMRGQAILRPLGVYATLLLVAYGGWFLWKYQVYGHAFAATVHSKMGFSGDRLLRGLQYVGTQYLESPWLFVWIPGLLAALRKERRAVGVPVALMPLGFAALAVVISGDFMTFGRFLVPGLPFTALLLLWILQDLCRRGGLARSLAPVLGVACVTLAALPGWNVWIWPTSLREAVHFRRRTIVIRSEYDVWHSMRQNAVMWAIRGRILRELFAPEDAIVMSAIGAAGYESRMNILDRHGFVSPVVAMRELTPEELAEPLRSPGHDHPVAASFFLEQGLEPVALRTMLIFSDDPRRVAAHLHVFSDECRDTMGDAIPYGLDFLEVPFEHESGMRLFFLAWRRLEDGVDLDAEQKRVAQRIREFRRFGEIERVEIETQRWHLAGLPSWLAADVPLPPRFTE